MRHKIWGGLVAAPLVTGAFGAASRPLAQQAPAAAVAQPAVPTPSPLPLPNPYRVDETFKPEVPTGLASLASVTAVKVGPDNQLYVFHRCVADSCDGHDTIDPILVYDLKGKLLRQMGAGMFTWPHGLFVAPDLSLWTADAGAPPPAGAPRKGQRVLHHDKSGKILLELGQQGASGSAPAVIVRPADVAVAKNGDIFVADGHSRDGRLVKFNSKGEYVTECGGPGSVPDAIVVPHGMVIDSQGRVFVADRNNSRLLIYDSNCKFFMEWRQFGRPTGIAIDRNDTLYVVDTQTTAGRPGFENGIYIGSAKDGKVTGFIPKVTPRSQWEVEAGSGARAGGRGRAGAPAGGAAPTPVPAAPAPPPEPATNMESIGVSPDGSTVWGGEVGLKTVIKFVKR